MTFCNCQELLMTVIHVFLHSHLNKCHLSCPSIWSLIIYNLLLLFCSWWRCGSVCPVEFWLVPICSVSTQSSSCRWTRRSPHGPALSVTSLPLLSCSLLMGKEQETRSDSSQCCSTKFLSTNSSSRVIFVGWFLGIVCKPPGCCWALVCHHCEGSKCSAWQKRVWIFVLCFCTCPQVVF